MHRNAWDLVTFLKTGLCSVLTPEISPTAWPVLLSTCLRHLQGKLQVPLGKGDYRFTVKFYLVQYYFVTSI